MTKALQQPQNVPGEDQIGYKESLLYPKGYQPLELAGEVAESPALEVFGRSVEVAIGT